MVLFSFIGYSLYFPIFDYQKTYIYFFKKNIFIYVGIPILYLLSIELFYAFKSTKNLSDIDQYRETNQNQSNFQLERNREERLTTNDNLDSFKLYF